LKSLIIYNKLKFSKLSKKTTHLLFCNKINYFFITKNN